MMMSLMMNVIVRHSWLMPVILVGNVNRCCTDKVLKIMESNVFVVTFPLMLDVSKGYSGMIHGKRILWMFTWIFSH